MWSHSKGVVGGRTSRLGYAPLISACNGERMVKIGAEIPKLSKNK